MTLFGNSKNKGNKKRKVNDMEGNIVLGSPKEKEKRQTGANYKWETSLDIPNFSTYQEYMVSVTRGGPASGPEKAKYRLHNKSRKKNECGEHLTTNFKCVSHNDCSHEVRSLLFYFNQPQNERA